MYKFSLYLIGYVRLTYFTSITRIKAVVMSRDVI